MRLAARALNLMRKIPRLIISSDAFGWLFQFPNSEIKTYDLSFVWQHFDPLRLGSK